MEFYHLRSFVVVAETSNLTLAAKRLYTTPPAVSGHIKALEKELNAALFTRTSRGMQLTDKGELLLKKARVTLDAAQDMVNFATETQSELIGQFNIGLNLSAQQLKLPTLAKNIQEFCPGIKLNSHLGTSQSIIKDIEEGALDGGYIFGDAPSSFCSTDIGLRDICVVSPKAMVGNSIGDIRELQELPWITMGNSCPFDDLLNQGMKGCTFQALLRSQDDNSRYELVKSGLGLSMLEQSEAEHGAQQGHFEILKLPAMTLPLRFVTSAESSKSPIVKAIVEELKVLWNIRT